MAGGMHGRGDMHGRGLCVADGVCIAGGIHGGGHVWQGVCMAGGMHGGGVCMAGGMHGRSVCMVGACMTGEGGVHGKGGGHAWQERQPLQRTVRILLECILVKIFHQIRHNNYSTFRFL